jgi:hypothetical protein
MKRFYLPVVFVLIVTMAFVSCNRQESPFDAGSGIPYPTPSGDAVSAASAVTATLIAGQRMDAGTVTCSMDGNTLYIEYATSGGWMLSETHLAVAGSLQGIPVARSGNPIPGHFPFKAMHDPPVAVFGYTVDLDAQGLAEAEMLYVAAHAVVKMFSGGSVVNEQSAWSEGEPFPRPSNDDRIKRKGNWAMYFVIDVQLLQGLLFWNRLGSDEEVYNSEIGPDGVIVGDVEYLPCKHGLGFKPLPRTGDPNIPDNFIDFSGLNLGNQGCVEFWYLPDWIDGSVGHVVEIFRYGVENDPQNSNHLGTHFNEWQNLMGTSARNAGHWPSVGMNNRPSNTPGWSTTEPFHMAFTWDGTNPVINDRLKFFVNGQRVLGGYSHNGDPTLDDWLPNAVLRLGSRLTSGDWQRHHWEGHDAVFDNIKVWSFPKTDFSDRFEE